MGTLGFTMLGHLALFRSLESTVVVFMQILKGNTEAMPRGAGGSHVACLNFKTSRVGVYKCLSLIVSFAVTVAIWPREVVSCRNIILRSVATFWVMSLVGIYPGRAQYKIGK